MTASWWPAALRSKQPSLLTPQISDVCWTGSFLLNLASTNYLQAASRIHSELSAVGLGVGMGGCYYAKGWNWQQLTAIYFPSLLLQLASLRRLESSKVVTSDTFCQCHCCPGAGTFSWWFLLFLLSGFFSFVMFCFCMPVFNTFLLLLSFNWMGLLTNFLIQTHMGSVFRLLFNSRK